jgi:hypothetical protein
MKELAKKLAGRDYIEEELLERTPRQESSKPTLPCCKPSEKLPGINYRTSLG